MCSRSRDIHNDADRLKTLALESDRIRTDLSDALEDLLEQLRLAGEHFGALLGAKSFIPQHCDGLCCVKSRYLHVSPITFWVQLSICTDLSDALEDLMQQLRLAGEHF